jgi:hypothetical protein
MDRSAGRTGYREQGKAHLELLLENSQYSGGNEQTAGEESDEDDDSFKEKLEQGLTIAVEDGLSLHLVACGCTRSAGHVDEMRRRSGRRGTLRVASGEFERMPCSRPPSCLARCRRMTRVRWCTINVT